MWRKTRKRKSLVLSFTEEARFRRTGAIFLCFSDNGGKHEASTWCESRTEGGVKKKERQNQLYTVPCTLYPVPCTLYPVPCTHTNCSSYFSPDTGGDCSKHGFMSRQHFLQRNVCFYASETYEKVIYLNVNKSSQLFWCFQMRIRASFVNLVRPLPSEDKSHKWHLFHPIVYSCCCCFFFKVSSILILNLLLYVLVNTSAMHFLCLSFTVGLFGIKRT